jgi:hypothetical protein
MVSRVAPAKGDLAIGQGDEAMVGDGHAMGVATEILEYILGAAEGWFGIDHPRLAEQGSQPGSEDLGLSQEFQVLGEAELILLEGGFETVHEFAAKNPAQHREGKKEASAGWNPVAVIERQPTGGNDAMDMGVKPSTPTIP